MKNNKKILLAVLGALASTHVGAVTYSYTTIDVPNYGSTIPTSINSKGQIAGLFKDETYALYGGDRGFTYINGAFKIFDIPIPPDTESLSLYDIVINDFGKVAGGSSYYNFPNYYNQGFLLNSGATKTTSFAVPNAFKTSVASINNNGEIAGNYDPLGSGVTRGYVYSGGKFTYIDVPTDLAGINSRGTTVTRMNDNGTVVGAYSNTSAGGSDSYIYNNGNYFKIPDPFSEQHFTLAQGINASGDIAGTYTGPNINPNNHDFSDNTHGFIYSGGNFEFFTPPSGTTGLTIFGINAGKQVVGFYTGGVIDARTSQSFVYSGGNFTYIDVPGAIRTEVHDINDNGQIVGTYIDAFSVPHGFLATPSDLPPPPPPTTPTSVSDCMNGGWIAFNFKSEKKCTQFVKKGK